MFAENWDAVSAFCNLGNRWDVDPWTGRHYAIIRTEIKATLDLMQFDRQKQLTVFEQLLSMEKAALEVLNKK